MDIPLEMCREEDWAINDEIRQTFNRMAGNNWLCPQRNVFFSLSGKFSTITEDKLIIEVYKCGFINTTNTTKTNCANQTEVD